MTGTKERDVALNNAAFAIEFESELKRRGAMQNGTDDLGEGVLKAVEMARADAVEQARDNGILPTPTPDAMAARAPAVVGQNPPPATSSKNRSKRKAVDLSEPETSSDNDDSSVGSSSLGDDSDASSESESERHSCRRRS